MPQLGLVLFIVCAIVAVAVAVQLSVRRWIRWAHRAADFGVADILNASRIDSDEAVAALRARFDAWSMVIKDGTARFCREDDVIRVQFFDLSGGADAEGFNDEHRYIRRATAARAQRLRDLAVRLQNGETRLRKYWVPRVSH